jgi:hypothetical protein
MGAKERDRSAKVAMVRRARPRKVWGRGVVGVAVGTPARW